ncbi:MAG: alpha-amylase family glycosyl hydrolase [Calditrichia bacterium]
MAQKHSVAHPQWSRNLAIYEVNVRQYTPHGTFAEFEKYLPQLNEMGVGILWLMPIHPIGQKNRKGSLGSYYSVRDYKAINPEFGNKEDFRRLVDKVHELGMYIIIDWVANHTAWDHPWAVQHPDFYTRDKTGNFISPYNWTDVIDLNYDNTDMRRAMFDALVYWIKEYDIDGYRCDVAAMVPTDFWETVRDTLDRIKPVFMLAEAHEPFLHDKAFDMTYGWQYKDLFNDIAAGKKTAADLADYYEKKEKRNYHPDAYRMIFTSNHDENSWHGTVFERLDGAAEALAVFCGVFRGMPLIYSGQEAGLNRRLKFFEKDTIQWKAHKFRDIYTKLFHAKKSNKALWNGIAGGDIVRLRTTNDKNVYAFGRRKGDDRILAVFNLSPQQQEISVTLTGFSGEYTDLFNIQLHNLRENQNFELEGWAYRVYID